MFAFDDDDYAFEVLKDPLVKYCGLIKNVVLAQTESIDTYMADLKNKPKDCEFRELTKSLIRDSIICGITNDQTKGVYNNPT